MNQKILDVRPMTPDEIEAAARADPDAQPLTLADLRRMQRTRRAKIVQRALNQFAGR